MTIMRPFSTGKMRGPSHLEHTLAEGMHVILRTMADTLNSSKKIDLDENEATMPAALTSDRSSLMERLRHDLLGHGEKLPHSAQESLFAATSLFERTIWLLGRYIALVAPTDASNIARHQARASETDPVASIPPS